MLSVGKVFIFLNVLFSFFVFFDNVYGMNTMFYLFDSRYVIKDNNFIDEEKNQDQDNDFIKPIDGVITSYFSYRIHPISKKEQKHTGIDIGAKWHDNVKACSDGEVVEVGCDKYGYGNYIKIKHKYDIYSFYAHLSKISVKKSQKVKKGQIIGKEGGDPQKDKNPGSSTGHHLHFEIRTSPYVEDCVNPLIFVDYK